MRANSGSLDAGRPRRHRTRVADILTGFWFHTDGRLLRSVRRELSAWVRKLPDEDKPPALAPLAFAGFGILGTLACTKRFQTATFSTQQSGDALPPIQEPFP